MTAVPQGYFPLNSNQELEEQEFVVGVGVSAWLLSVWLT